MPARTHAPRWSAIAISLTVSLLTLGLAPSAKATTSYSDLWVASSSTATASAPGTSCAAPGYIGSSESAVFGAIEDAATGATIHLCAGVYAISSTAEIAVADLSIVGAGHTTTFIAGFRSVPFFQTGGNLTISGLTITGGYSGSVEGGAVLAEGTLTVLNSSFYNNYSEKGGGAIAAGAVVVDNSSFYNNTTTDQGGAIASYGTVTVTNSVFSSNQSIADTACIGGGGAIAAYDDVHVTGSRFTGNSAVITTSDSCGGMDPYAGPYGGKGGAIATTGYVWATDTTFTANRAELVGGAVAELNPMAPTRVTDIGGTYLRATFTGNEASYLAGGAISVHGTTTISSSSFKGNRASWYGGSAIYSDSNTGVLKISRSSFANNVVLISSGACMGACGAGAISGGTVNVTTSVFDSNTGGLYGGAIGAVTLRVTHSVFNKNKALWSGGAITGNAIVVKYSRFTANAVMNPFASIEDVHGGGAIFVCSTLDVDYSTFTRNSATSKSPSTSFYGNGGAIAGYGTTAVISHTWFVKNMASGRGGAVALGTTTNGPTGGAMAVTLTRNRFNYNVAGSYGGAVELGSTTAVALAASKYNSFVGNRAGTGGAIMSVFTAGGITQANLNSFATKNPSKGNRGPGRGLLLIVAPI